ncbi:WD repeat-containing protein on Y chromosome-like [Xenentodon cancila]
MIYIKELQQLAISTSDRESFVVDCLEPNPISTVCYNIQNNMLVLANKNIAKCLGKGTDMERVTEKKQCVDSPNQKVKRVDLKMSICQKVYTSTIVVSLKTRKADERTATLLISVDGNIFSWSVGRNAELMGKFKAVESDHAFITAMSTDEREKTLLTGDSTGRVCLWDIQDFGFRTENDSRPLESLNRCNVSRSPPPLLISWQASTSAIVSVVCDPACKKVFTGGLDHNVKLWTNKGDCVGIFGKDLWNSSSAKKAHPAEEAETIDLKEYCLSQVEL